MHFKPTVGCQISTLIFENKLWKGVSINIPLKIYQGRQPKHLCQLKIRAISLTYLKVGKNFAVLDIFSMGYLWRPPSTICFQISKLIFDTFK
jgi:hypothetical protein